MGTIARPNPSYLPSHPNPLKVAALGALSFAACGTIGGVFLGMRLAAVQTQNAENAAKAAQQAQQAAETRLQGNLAATSKFCQATLASPPSGNPQPQPTAVAANQP
jgi:type II secretory pathway pseudopilin PulG